jgi:hypothetical protein
MSTFKNILLVNKTTRYERVMKHKIKIYKCKEKMYLSEWYFIIILINIEFFRSEAHRVHTNILNSFTKWFDKLGIKY